MLRPYRVGVTREIEGSDGEEIDVEDGGDDVLEETEESDEEWGKEVPEQAERDGGRADDAIEDLGQSTHSSAVAANDRDEGQRNGEEIDELAMEFDYHGPQTNEGGVGQARSIGRRWRMRIDRMMRMIMDPGGCRCAPFCLLAPTDLPPITHLNDNDDEVEDSHVHSIIDRSDETYRRLYAITTAYIAVSQFRRRDKAIDPIDIRPSRPALDSIVDLFYVVDTIESDMENVEDGEGYWKDLARQQLGEESHWVTDLIARDLSREATEPESAEFESDTNRLHDGAEEQNDEDLSEARMTRTMRSQFRTGSPVSLTVTILNPSGTRALKKFEETLGRIAIEGGSEQMEENGEDRTTEKMGE
ncbi:hypothetical protein HK102_012473 [Quaeritorhiza haematococci]|nr:hypothetical protein HK102_012473 [Quaeritorhiza haematococci]